jgi:hypothetical protein
MCAQRSAFAAQPRMLQQDEAPRLPVRLGPSTSAAVFGFLPGEIFGPDRRLGVIVGAYLLRLVIRNDTPNWNQYEPGAVLSHERSIKLASQSALARPAKPPSEATYAEAEHIRCRRAEVLLEGDSSLGLRLFSA